MESIIIFVLFFYYGRHQVIILNKNKQIISSNLSKKYRHCQKMSYIKNYNQNFDLWGKTNLSLFQTQKKNINKTNQLAEQLNQQFQSQNLVQQFTQAFTLNQNCDLQKEDIQYQLSLLDKKLAAVHAIKNYDPDIVNKSFTCQDNQDLIKQEFMSDSFGKISKNQFHNSKILVKSQKLSIPKANTLTDSLLRSTLGCDEKYAKSYLQILDQTAVTQDKQKQKRIDETKKKFAMANSYVDFCANSKPHMQNYKYPTRPVIDNEHEAYLKTQLIFLQKPKNLKGKNDITTKQYYDKHSDQITKKIQELGGMEDTLGRMEDTLSKNQIKSFKKRQILDQLSTSPRKNPFTITQSYLVKPTTNKDWMERSKTMREGFKQKFNI